MANKTLTAQTIFKYTDEDGVAQSKATTSAATVLAGTIAYKVFGDPV